MVRFLKNIFLFSLQIFIMCVIADYSISEYLKNSQGRKYDKWTKIINSDFKEIDLLIFGSSRAWVQYSPIILDSILGTNSYNLGIDGSGCNRHILCWQLYEDFHNIRPKYIIHNVDYFATLVMSTGYEREQFYPFFWNLKFRKKLFAFEPFSFLEKFMPMYRYTRWGCRKLLLIEDTSLCRGYEGQNLKWDASVYNSIDSIAFDFDLAAYRLFEKYIEDVQSKNIKLIFVMSPTYYGTKAKSTQLDTMYTIYNNLSKKYDIPLLDFTFCELSMDTTLFYNAMHLNKDGAELFSKQLANRMKESKIIYKNKLKLE